MVDYRKFLSKSETRVLPYLGGVVVHAADRTFRVSNPPERTGWYRFVAQGRDAQIETEADPESLESLEPARGHLVGDRLFVAGGKMALVHLLPDDEPPVFAPVTARRWYSGDLIFESLDFETEAEEAVRNAVQEGTSIANVKSVPATLRTAYGFELSRRVGAEIRAPVAFVEVRHAIHALADEGRPAATRLVQTLVAQRLEERRRRELELARRIAELTRAEREALERWEEERRGALARQVVAEAHHALAAMGPRWYAEESPIRRAVTALENAGARFLGARRLDRNRMLEVTFEFMGDRFQSIVDATTLNVIDAGICLQGHDGLLTLESLPSAIKEAMEEDIVHHTRGWE